MEQSGWIIWIFFFFCLNMLDLLDPSPKPKDLFIILKVKHQSSGIEKPQLLKYWGVYKILASPPLTSFMFGSSLFPILLSLHALSCQSSARNYADSSLWKHATVRIYASSPFPFCTFLLNCLKMDDLNLIWRSNIFAQFLYSLLLCFGPPSASLKADLTGRCSEQDWRVYGNVCTHLSASSLACVYSWVYDVHCHACAGPFTSVCVHGVSGCCQRTHTE